MLLDKQVSALAEDLVRFMQKKFGFDHLPTIAYVDDKVNSSNLLCMTGGYDQENESITIYITGRHPKDILRSLAHEMMHHVQKCEGMMNGKDMSATVDPNYIMHDDFLKNIEADAFERGNICFREWEATKKGDNTMNEAKKKLKEKKKVKAISFDQSGLKHPEKADTKPPDGKLQPWEIAVAKNIEASQEDRKEKEEVQVNEALKNAHNYSTVTRALPETAAARDEFVFQELMKKFKITK